MTAHDQAALSAAVAKLAELADAGADPTAAAVEVAHAHGLTPGRLKIVCGAYNVGAQLARQEAGETCAEKFASGPAADADEAVRLFTAKTAKVAAAAAAPAGPPAGFGPPPGPRFARATKTAAVGRRGPPPAPAFDRSAEKRADARLVVARARGEAEDAVADVHRAVAKLANYFVRSPYDRAALPDVVKCAYAHHGPTAAALVDRAFALSRARPDREPKTAGAAIPAGTGPLAFVAEAEAAAARYAAAVPKVAAAAVKAANLLQIPAVGAMLGTMAVRSGLSPTEPSAVDEQADRYLGDLDSPDHADAIRRIRARAMLAQIMGDPEDPASGYPPERVLDAYNEMAQLAPRASEQPAVVGPWLRRRLAGRVEPFEAKTVSDVEKSLTETHPAAGPQSLKLR